MKGGFRPIGESVEDKLDAQKSKDLGGHSYNVARQQKAYDDAIRRIWEAQKRSLSSAVEASDEDTDADRDDEDEVFRKQTPGRSERPTPAFGRRDDETTSQFSRLSTSSQSGKIMRIRRHIRNSRGETEEVEEIVRDPRVIKQYQKIRYQAELNALTLRDLKPTGDPEKDARCVKMVQNELQRLQRNKDRRHAREKQKSMMADREGSPSNAGSPAPASSSGTGAAGAGAAAKGTGTLRKCANCGQVGHIKTNKKYVPSHSSRLEQLPFSLEVRPS
jgi:transcription initiation factor TFIID subunit 1